MKRARIFVYFAGVVVLGEAACNVFMTLERCTSDSDCPSGTTCDPEGRFCTRPAPPTDAPITDEPPPDTKDVVSQPEAAPPPPCDVSAPFGKPVPVAGLESTAISSARMLGDERTILYSALNGCTQEQCADLFVAHRAERDGGFDPEAAAPLAVVGCSTASEYWPTLTGDGKVLFFESGRDLDGGCTEKQAHIWTATRVSPAVDFDPPKIQSTFAANDYESAPYLHPLGKTVYFGSLARPGKGSMDIFVAQRNDGFVTRVDNVDAVNTPREENMALVTYDEKNLDFSRVDLFGARRDIYVSERASPSDAFGEPKLVPELNAPQADAYPSWISDDQCRMYFVSNRDWTDFSTYRLFVAERPPVM